MPSLRLRRPLEVIADAEHPLCRNAENSCIACCRGGRMSRRDLTLQLRRQTRLFTQSFQKAFPTWWNSLGYELAARRGLDLIWSVVFAVPGLGPLLREYVHQRTCCAFLGFVDDLETLPGCLLHPSRHQGVDQRQQLAFAIIPGFGCLEPGFQCETTLRYLHSSWEGRQRFRSITTDQDWFDYSRSVAEF
jgi:hypothetical protein